MIGAEARKLLYAQEQSPDPGWQSPDLNDSTWQSETYSYGPRFWRLGPLPADADVTALEAKLAGLKQVDPTQPIEVGGKKYSWRPYEFSMRWGVEGDPGRQGYHGLKELVSDDFIILGRKRIARTTPVYDPEPEGTRYYLWTSAVAARDGAAQVLGRRSQASGGVGERVGGGGGSGQGCDENGEQSPAAAV